MAGGPPRGRPSRSRRHALRPGRHGNLREQSRPMGRRHLCDARPRGDVAGQSVGPAAGPRGQAHRRAAPAHTRARRRDAARPDRRRARRARRGVPRLDPSGRHDLGLLHLYDSVQSRPVVPVLRLAAAMAASAARSGRRLLRAAGCRLYRALALRAARPGRSLRGAVARDRARAAGARHPVPGRRAHEFSEPPSATRPSSPCGPRS